METFPAAVAGQPGPAPGSARSRTRKRRRHSFAKGFLVGALLVIPLISLAIFAVSRLGLGGERPGIIAIVRLVTVFAVLPAVVTAGGVGRLAAQASLHGGRRRAVWVAARALAFGGAGLAIIGAMPCEVTPETWPGWVVLAAAGMVAGALAGIGVGLACGGPMPSLTDLGIWPHDGSVGRAVERVITRARRRPTTGPPPTDRP
ncbi:MAG: hypothetical protein IPL61_11655 [Myxococcales bacterium]|nr:hypothetical protein [Myxococcales bacterium]